MCVCGGGGVFDPFPLLKSESNDFGPPRKAQVQYFGPLVTIFLDFFGGGDYGEQIFLIYRFTGTSENNIAMGFPHHMQSATIREFQASSE